MPGPTCEACKVQNDPKCKKCSKTPSGPFYQFAQNDAGNPTTELVIMCQGCFVEDEGVSAKRLTK